MNKPNPNPMVVLDGFRPTHRPILPQPASPLAAPPGAVFNTLLKLWLEPIPGFKGYTHVGGLPGKILRRRKRTVVPRTRAQCRRFQLDRMGDRYLRSIRQDEVAWVMWRGRMFPPMGTP